MQSLKPHIEPLYDGEFALALASSMTSKHWKNGTITWSELLQRLQEPTVTGETRAEYNRLSREEQLKLKDRAGGYVGGPVNGQRRTRQAVPFRQLLCLDADFAGKHFMENALAVMEHAVAVHTTRKHTAAEPKYRILIPLDRPVNFEEYQAIARRLAQQLGMAHFDHTCFQFERLMFWPTVSKDDRAHYILETLDAPWLSADAVLDTYRQFGGDHRNVSLWPMHDREMKALDLEVRKAGKPEDKPGVIGAFCRAWDIESGIAEFLSDVYTPAGEGRWTYAQGSSAAGVWQIPGEEYIKSFHGTDPVGNAGKPVCLWDAVRIHKFGDLDGDLEGNENPSQLLSHARMLEWVVTLDPVRNELLADDFDVIEEEVAPADWRRKLTIDDKGNVMALTSNVVTILEGHETYRGRLRRNEFTGDLDILGDLPWRHGAIWTDTDTSYIKSRLEVAPWRLKKRDIIEMGIDQVANNGAYHPVRDYLNGLHWDGKKRLETLLVDYFGVEDTRYTRVTTRKFFVGAVARVMEPGVKWDNVLVLVGAQGVGKSTFARKISKGWYTDSMTSMQGKEGMEAVQGKWIIELGEMSAMKKAEIEHVKAFVTSQTDKFRPAYGRRTVSLPRQCVFLGTTNEPEFLKDMTGNRRWWPASTHPSRATRCIFNDLTAEEVDQVWAEAHQLYCLGEELFLTAEEAELAKVAQDYHTELPPAYSIVEQWLEQKVPEGWAHWSETQRTLWDGEGTELRQKVSATEIWYEALKGRNHPARHEVAEIKAIMRKMGTWKDGKGLIPTPYGRQRFFERS